MSRRRLLVTAAVTIALVASLIPFPYQVCPSWEVSVVDTSGSPLPGMTVRLSYQDYSVNRASHEQDRTTDSQGRASFPERVTSRAFASRGGGALLSALSQGVHASLGRHAYVMAFGQGLQGSDFSFGVLNDWKGEPNHMSSKITAEPSHELGIPGPKKLPLLQ
jgi:hypothetical protein